MTVFFTLFKKFARNIKRENFHRVLGILLLLVLVGSIAFWYFEKKFGFIDALWWSVVTITTVGYGDFFPVTAGGRVAGIALMLLGIGFLGLLTAKLAGIFVEGKIMESKGMNQVKATGHFLLCGWNYRGSTIISELRADGKSRNTPIVIVANVAEKPSDGPHIHFVHGDIDQEALERASAGDAEGAIVLADESLEANVRDAKTILATLTLKSLYPELHVCIELMDSKNVEHAARAKADEIIVVGDLSANLLVRATLDHGMTNMIADLVSNRRGCEFYKIDVPSGLVGRTFIEAVTELKKDHNVLCMGIEIGESKRLVPNPESDYPLHEADHLIVVAADRPNIMQLSALAWVATENADCWRSQSARATKSFCSRDRSQPTQGGFHVEI